MELNGNKLLEQIISNVGIWVFIARTFGVAASAFGARMQFRAVLFKFGMSRVKVQRISNNSVVIFNLIISILMALLLNGLKLPENEMAWYVWGLELTIYSSLALMVHWVFKYILIPIVEKKYKIKIDGVKK